MLCSRPGLRAWLFLAATALLCTGRAGPVSPGALRVSRCVGGTLKTMECMTRDIPDVFDAQDGQLTLTRSLLVQAIAKQFALIALDPATAR